MKNPPKLILRLIAVFVSCLHPEISMAQVTGPSDAGRVNDRVKEPLSIEVPQSQPQLGGKVVSQAAPAGSEKISFILKDIVLSGGENISKDKALESYSDFLDKEITLDKVWFIASRLTDIYQKEGYFLSRVYVPNQEIGSGRVTLNVVEGYISEVSLDDLAKENSLASQWVNRLVNKKPLKSQELESLLLRLNELAGHNYRAVLEFPSDKNAPEGASRLSILTAPERMRGQTVIDNYGSRFLGPEEISQQLSFSVLPNQKTNMTLLSDIQSRELRYGGITQYIPLSYQWDMDLAASITGARPGDTLKVQDIISKSKNYSVGVTFHQIKQREEGLSYRVSYEVRDASSKILGSFPLSKDHIRMISFGLNYQRQDNYGGYNLGGMTFSQGLKNFGASEAGDDNLSRAQAKPGRSKLEISYSRVQSLPKPLPRGFSVIGSLSGQLASGPLYASEEFGYGGQNFGRAYDSSEITGDNGVSGSLELRYQGIPKFYYITMMPYGFYDIGKVWNKDVGQKEPLSGSSAGFGIKLASNLGLSTNFGMAFPLTREIAAPLNGDKQGPRYMLQLSYNF